MSQLVAYGTSANDSIIRGGAVSYAASRTAASGNYRSIADSTTDFLQIGQAYQSGPTDYGLCRAFLFFDTSSITANAIIDSAILSIYGYYDQTDTDFNVVVQNGQPTYPSNTATADVTDAVQSADDYGFTLDGGIILNATDVPCNVVAIKADVI